MRLYYRISYDYLLEASFRNKVFTFSYRSLNVQGQQVDKHLYFRCPHHRIARYLFRLLTEDHTFFCHETVSEKVLEHVRTRPWQELCQKYLGRTYHRVYHFDIVRTQHEAYSHAWEKLHQVDQETLNTRLSVTSSAVGNTTPRTVSTSRSRTGLGRGERGGENSTTFADNVSERDIDT